MKYCDILYEQAYIFCRVDENDFTYWFTTIVSIVEVLSLFFKEAYPNPPNTQFKWLRHFPLSPMYFNCATVFLKICLALLLKVFSPENLRTFYDFRISHYRVNMVVFRMLLHFVLTLMVPVVTSNYFGDVSLIVDHVYITDH